ncbi:MAG: hypothetical protein KA099_04930 [Alphaproteobacteria bacterium]|nr:hypothetical protein [Alphaproteobacteria bacterium]MBP7758828.1 hypothetical protein [Alphaproteobacteria bacterium]MBP7762098.1 hypothetical protein [Alphaproteobacteria bacterium]MBP7904655.1 hypothetical protein [Alphaproteobacteria bacterium]
MPVDLKTATHICKVIARQIETGYPELTLTFIVHEEDKRKKALVQEKETIGEHPAGPLILDYILNSKDKEITGNRTCFVGLVEHSSPGILGFFRSTRTLGIFFVNADRFNTQEDLKNHALHLVWHALALYEDFHAAQAEILKKAGTLPSLSKTPPKPNNAAVETQKTENSPLSRLEITEGIIITKLDTQEYYHRNLLADIFSATFQALHGTENAIKSLAVQRMQDTLAPQIGFISEKYPFPISLETLQLLLTESLSGSGKKEKTLPLAVRITKEIGMTFKISAIKQWRAFCNPAQEMAWCGFDRETILGAAIYTNENTYVRSIADMVAEHMAIKPKIFSSLNDYNPFADQEMNKRVHEKIALESARKSMDKVRTPEDYKIFLSEAMAQNAKLMSGNPVGWAAHALIALSDELMLADPKTLNQQKPRLLTIFEQNASRVSWDNIRSFARYLFRQRREGRIITPDIIATVPDKTEDIALIKETFRKLSEAYSTMENGRKTDGKETATGNITSFISPNALK